MASLTILALSAPKNSKSPLCAPLRASTAAISRAASAVSTSRTWTRPSAAKRAAVAPERPKACMVRIAFTASAA